jgi:UDP-glucose 4-epimerase
VRVLVTGGRGFVGTVVAVRLAGAGHEVTTLGRAGPLAADLRDRDALARAVEGFDAVCHLAARTRVREAVADPVGTWSVNVGGTINLLEALAAAGVARLVFASTGAVYGPDAPAGVTEDASPAPSGPYAGAKLAAEQAIGFAAASGALGAVTLRCGNAAGAVELAPGRWHGDPDPTRLVPRVVAAAAGGPALGVNGDGSAVREYIHVADLAGAFVLAVGAAEPGRHLVLNAGSGTGVSVGDVIGAVEAVSGRPVAVEHHPPADEPRALVTGGARARAELGWHPARSDLASIVADAWAGRG